MAPYDHQRKIQIQTMSPSPISKLGDGDLLVEVLIRLPDAKSTVRCRAVCKPWKSLLSTPEFSRRLISHRRTVTEPPLLVLSEPQGPIWSFLPETTATRSILDCFRDLVLLVTEDREQGVEESGRSFMVCNPFTKQWIAIPLAPQMPKERDGKWTARLVCEPCSSIPFDLGDGEEIIHHPVEYRFLVVRIYELLSPMAMLDVFCPRSREWTTLDPPPYDISPYFGLHNVSVSLNGKLYWETGLGTVTEWNPFRQYNDDDNDDESSPIVLDAPGYRPGYGVWKSRGALHMIYLMDDVLSVWWLDREEEGLGEDGAWMKLYEVSVKKVMHCTVVDDRGHEIDCSEREIHFLVGQHAEKPEIVFFAGWDPRGNYAFFSCDLRTEKVEFIAPWVDTNHQDQLVFQLGTGLWPTPLSR